jgi:hypothetical protein
VDGGERGESGRENIFHFRLLCFYSRLWYLREAIILKYIHPVAAMTSLIYIFLLEFNIVGVYMSDITTDSELTLGEKRRDF